MRRRTNFVRLFGKRNAINSAPLCAGLFICSMRSFSGRRGRRPLQNLDSPCRGRHPWRPAPTQINSLNEQGLGGACELARARARVTLAPTVCPWVWNFLLIFFESAFLKGCGGTFFAKKVPPHPFKKALSKNIRRKFQTHGQTVGARVTLALALANSQAPPRPCSLRELICVGAGRQGCRPLQGESKFCRGRRPRRPENERILQIKSPAQSGAEFIAFRFPNSLTKFVLLRTKTMPQMPF